MPHTDHHGDQPSVRQGDRQPAHDLVTGPTASSRPSYGRALVQDAVVITLRTDSFECPDCGVIVVATDDRVIDLASGHDCVHPASTTGLAG